MGIERADKLARTATVSEGHSVDLASTMAMYLGSWAKIKTFNRMSQHQKVSATFSIED